MTTTTRSRRTTDNWGAPLSSAKRQRTSQQQDPRDVTNTNVPLNNVTAQSFGARGFADQFGGIEHYRLHPTQHQR